MISEAEKPDRTLFYFELLSVGGALVILLSKSAELYRVVRGSPLNPDVQDFLQFGQNADFFFDTGRREPLHAFLLHMSTILFGEVEQGARLLTVGITLCTALALYLVGKKFAGMFPAFLATLAFCFTPTVIFYSVSGMRAPLLALFMLLLFAAVTTPSVSRRNRLLFLCVVAGLSVTLRVYSALIIVIALPLYWLSLRRRAIGNKAILLEIVAVLVATFVPILLWRFFSPSQIGADINFYRGIEYHGDSQLLLGEESVSLFHYIFVEHSLLEVLRRISGNYVLYFQLYLRHYLKGFAFLIYLAPLCAVILLAARRWPLIYFWGLTLGPVVFVLHLNQQPGFVGLENRFVLHTYAFALLIFAMAPCVLAARFLRKQSWVHLLDAGRSPQTSLGTGGE